MIEYLFMRSLTFSFITFSLLVLKDYKGNFNSFQSNTDTTVSFFENYRLRIHIFNSQKQNDFISSKNATITFTKFQNQKSFNLFSDSVFCFYLNLKFEDLNNDGVKDLLVLYDHDVRGNTMYHLYLVNPKTKKLLRVKGFEEVKNPVFNHKKSIIESHVVSGRNYSTFYKINKLN